MLLCAASAGAHLTAAHPISRVARIFDKHLVSLEDRITWLNGQLATLATLQQPELRNSFGVRCGRIRQGDPDPSLTLDLGKTHSLDTLYLVPAQQSSSSDEGIFPQRFTIEVSDSADFKNPVEIYTSGEAAYPAPGIHPVRFTLAGKQARYIRLTVHAGHLADCADVFGLSEIVAISDHQPVSFGAKVTAVGSITTPGQWFPEAVTDGSMPLGIWQNIQPSPTAGDHVDVSENDGEVSWSLSLAGMDGVESVVLYPYQLNDSPESAIFPEAITLTARSADGERRTIHQWNNPLPGSHRTSPLVIPTVGVPLQELTITATRPWQTGSVGVQALSEIEVWSRSENLARHLPITRSHGGKTTTLTALTDGYSSRHMILPVATWLEQLCRRSHLQGERDSLLPLAHGLASRSELHTTWGSAVMLGLGFFVPVAIVERRRFLSRTGMEKLRKRIAEDLHNDIGSHLGSISLIARTARKDLAKINGPRELVQDLGEMESMALESSLAMRDIMWLLEQDQPTLGDLVQRICDTTARLLCGVEHRIDAEIEKPGVKLSLDSKRHLFLFCKEAVQNILKTPQVNHVSLNIRDTADHLALEFSGVGVGLPLSPDHRQSSLQKLEDRARLLEGSLHVESSTEQGSRILLLVKRSHLNLHSSLP